MKFNTADLAPWADFVGIIKSARSLRIEAGGRVHEGEFDVDIDDDGCVTVAVGALPQQKPKAANDNKPKAKK